MQNQSSPLALSGILAVAAGAAPVAFAGGNADDDHAEIQMDSNARMVEHDSGLFLPDPDFGDTWDIGDQKETYAKSPVVTQRPLLELGRELYSEGPFQPGRPFIFGQNNLLYPWLLVYGDWRTAIGTNSIDLDGDGANENVGQLSTRLNLEIDAKLTATERVHAFWQPFEQPGDLTRVQFGDLDDSELEVDGNLDALFFEGDLGAMFGGSDGTISNFDMPIAFGLMPLLFQNGVWVEDAFTGIALTIPAKNSPALNISNYDITFFAGFDNVDSGAFLDAGGSDSDSSIFGATAFVDALQGYFEFGYGLTVGDDDAPDADYHNLTAAYSRRYGEWLSNSVRLILNFGQDEVVDLDGDAVADKTADGVLLLVENSLVTSKPYTFIPYVNLFANFGTAQPLAKQVGGVLKNTGITFEADALTLFPSLDDDAFEAVGFAAGLNNLFGLDQQLVLEVSARSSIGDIGDVVGEQFAVGARWQKPISHRWIVRADAIYGILDDIGGVTETDDIFGVRVEFRWKF